MSSTIEYVSLLFVDGKPVSPDWKAVTISIHSMLGDLENKMAACELNVEDPVYLCAESSGMPVKYFIDIIECAPQPFGIHFLRLQPASNLAIAYEFKQRDGILSNYSLFQGDGEGDPLMRRPDLKPLMRRPSAAPSSRKKGPNMQVKTKKESKKKVVRKPAAASEVEPPDAVDVD
jgi:hypothetical protein